MMSVIAYLRQLRRAMHDANKSRPASGGSRAVPVPNLLWQNLEGHVAVERAARCCHSDRSGGGADWNTGLDCGSSDLKQGRSCTVEGDAGRARQIVSQDDHLHSHLAE